MNNAFQKVCCESCHARFFSGFRLRLLRFAPTLLAAVALIRPAIACEPLVPPSFNAATYYQGTEGLAGEALKAALNDRIDGHLAHAKSCLWTILAEADADPDDPNAVIVFYTQRSIPVAERDFGGNTPDAWNREHIWASSHGFSDSNQHAHTDAHHLVAADKSVNADRADHDFGEADAPAGLPDDECSECREDEARGIWEPPDALKGDVARMMFYMDVRYDGDASEPTATGDLALVNRTTSSGEPNHGLVCDLIGWHIADPVSERETRRQSVVFRWQGNRNPFIDRPEFALAIWGPACGIEAPVAIADSQRMPFPFLGLMLLAAGIAGIAGRNLRSRAQARH